MPILAAAVVLLGFGATSCIRTQNEVDVKPIEIKPVHITLDINIRIEKALDDFFGELDAL
ncbi:MAG: YnbE family lipoprotein [Lentisphaeria bacterium]|nr:YnbE family lipoprotein [Lentisphaeria bacterium]